MKNDKKAERMFAAIGEIDEKYVEEADGYASFRKKENERKGGGRVETNARDDEETGGKKKKRRKFGSFVGVAAAAVALLFAASGIAIAAGIFPSAYKNGAIWEDAGNAAVPNESEISSTYVSDEGENVVSADDGLPSVDETTPSDSAIVGIDGRGCGATAAGTVGVVFLVSAVLFVRRKK